MATSSGPKDLTRGRVALSFSSAVTGGFVVLFAAAGLLLGGIGAAIW